MKKRFKPLLFLIIPIFFLEVGCGTSPGNGNGGVEKDTLTDVATLGGDPVNTPQADKPVVRKFEPRSYAKPQELNYYGKAEPDNLTSEFFFLPTKLYPIGWSASRKFAYLKEPADEACGCYFLNFCIQDMDSDKLIYEWEYESENVYNGGEDHGDNFDAVWKSKATDFVKILNEHEIEPIEKVDYRPGQSFSTDLARYKVRLETERAGAKDDNIAYEISSAQMWVSLEGKGEKRVFSETMKDWFLAREMKVSGSVLSPFEPRAAIILQKTIRGYEGPPHVVSFELVGCDLDEGF